MLILDLLVYLLLDMFFIVENGLIFEDVFFIYDVLVGVFNFFDYFIQDFIYQDILIEVVEGIMFEIDLGIDVGINNSNYLWYWDGNVDVVFNSNIC